MPILTMATNHRNGPIRPLTEFAQKYGIYKGGMRGVPNVLQGYKSGHTPISARRADESLARRRWKDALAEYHSYTLKGFPMEWARALRAYIPTANTDFAGDWPKAELGNPIHPLIDLRQWETLNGCLMNYPPPCMGNGLPDLMVVSVPLLVETIISTTNHDTGRKQNCLGCN